MKAARIGAPTGGDAIGAALAAAGATHAFGMPGGEVLALIDGLAAAGIRFVLARHETAAGFMAEGLWHTTGALPVLVATLGPGVANAVNVVANAAQDRVPLVVLTGCVDAELAESYTHQVFDHQAVLRPLVKATFRASAGTAGAVIAKAVAVARDGQPGPVHVDVPIAVAEDAALEAAMAAPVWRTLTAPAVEDAVLRDAVARLARAERPLAIAGIDAVNEGAGPAVAAFCRAQGVPLLTTYKGKGLLPEDDRLALGGVGLSPKADALVLPLVAAADCIVLIGYDPIEMRAGWRQPWPAGQTVIEIAPVLRTHGMHVASHVLTGAIGPTLARLAAAPVRDGRWPDGAPAQVRTALAAAFGGETGPGGVFRRLRALMPAGTVATADSGAHRILFSQMWTCEAPRGLLQSTGLCTMACALPLAIGAKLGVPERPVLAVVGDGGLEMGAGELATLRDLGLPVLIVVMVDQSLALIEMKQRAAGRPPLGVTLGATDFPALARAFGGTGVWVDGPDALDREVPAALARDGFTLLACRIAPGAYDGTF